MLRIVEDCRTRASTPPQTHVSYKAVDGPSSRYIAQSTFSHIQRFVEGYELPERRCRRVQLDRGGENVSREFTLWAYDNGIELGYTDTEQHQANRCAEALNRILENKLHPTLLSSKLPDTYWPPVVKYGIAYVRNRSPSVEK
jgi:hypothetical protein